MKKYRGYYIGTGANDFHSEAEIDEFLRSRDIKWLKFWVHEFHKYRSMEASSVLSDHELRIMRQHGFTPVEIEELEIKFMREEAEHDTEQAEIYGRLA